MAQFSPNNLELYQIMCRPRWAIFKCYLRYWSKQEDDNFLHHHMTGILVSQHFWMSGCTKVRRFDVSNPTLNFTCFRLMCEYNRKVNIILPLLSSTPTCQVVIKQEWGQLIKIRNLLYKVVHQVLPTRVGLSPIPRPSGKLTVGTQWIEVSEWWQFIDIATK